MKFHLVAFSLALVACGGSKSQPASTANPCVNPCAAEQAKTPEVDVTGWKSWTKVNAERKFSEGHGKTYVDVYVKPELADTYRAATGPYPQGATIVKPQYQSKDAAEPDKLTVMVKREDGYDPDNANWWYGVYSAGGTEVLDQGKIEMCIGCHVQAADQDYVFGMK